MLADRTLPSNIICRTFSELRWTPDLFSALAHSMQLWKATQHISKDDNVFMEVIMKTTLKTIALSLIACSSAYAAAGTVAEDAGLLVYLFAGFFAVIIISQLVPASILLFGMLKGIFASDRKSSAVKSK